MLSSKLKFILLLIGSLIILLIPSLMILVAIFIFLFIFNLLFIYKYYYPYILVIMFLCFLFGGFHLSILFTVKLLIIFSLLSSYLKNTSIKKFQNNVYEIIYILSKFEFDIKNISNHITLFFYKPYIYNIQSNKIKKSLALQGLDIYHSNSKGKFIVYKYIFKNISRLVKEEKKKVIAIL